MSIFVKEYATGGISVLGEVQKPGIYPLLGHRTLLDAISAAGGTTPKAGKTVSITHRDRPNSPEIIMLSRDEGETMSNEAVRPGDTVAVSKAGMVYVVGDVKEPTGIIMDNPHLTVFRPSPWLTEQIRPLHLVRPSSYAKTNVDPMRSQYL